MVGASRSLRSKRFRVVSEQRKTVSGDPYKTAHKRTKIARRGICGPSQFSIDVPVFIWAEGCFMFYVFAFKMEVLI